MVEAPIVEHECVVPDVSITRIIIAGLAGAASMALATAVFNALRVPMVDFGRLIATKILRYHSHGTGLGLGLHLVNGVLLSFFYAMAVDPFLPGGSLVRGLLYGLGVWAVMMVVVLPLLGDGFFGWRTSRQMIPSALAVHLLYGLVLGIVIQ